MKALKNIFMVLLAGAMLFGFASCSDDDDDGGDTGRTLTLNFDISSFTDGTYYAKDPELEDVSWYLSLDESSWEFGAKVPTGYYGSTTIYDDTDFYKGTFTVANNKITLTKTHYIDALNGMDWKAYSSEKSNWKSGTLSDSKLSMKFTTSELDYKTATQQKIISIPKLERN